jgi:hypothetical protein
MSDLTPTDFIRRQQEALEREQVRLFEKAEEYDRLATNTREKAFGVGLGVVAFKEVLERLEKQEGTHE